MDEAKARAFLRRALFRYAGSLNEGEGDGAGVSESWTLMPGWNLAQIHMDELSQVEDLVYQAVYDARAITVPVPEVDIELLVDARLGGDWTYQWRVSFPPGNDFALCSPYSEDFDRLGFHRDDPKAKGCQTALAILREAVAVGNQLLAAYARGCRPAGGAAGRD